MTRAAQPYAKMRVATTLVACATTPQIVATASPTASQEIYCFCCLATI
ncbi:hypothetical protein HU200_028086 [Digitaria exilis]|uniref:Uncharacterized protein n=1 Tax=Digitaria exilis TaxID=1010633 RepID=A0A835BSW7_9POAL|nr:hypothetical protein HU200_028086 [Digitaria exilis]